MLFRLVVFFASLSYSLTTVSCLENDSCKSCYSILESRRPQLPVGDRFLGFFENKAKASARSRRAIGEDNHLGWLSLCECVCQLEDTTSSNDLQKRIRKFLDDFQRDRTFRPIEWANRRFELDLECKNGLGNSRREVLGPIRPLAMPTHQQPGRREVLGPLRPLMMPKHAPLTYRRIKPIELPSRYVPNSRLPSDRQRKPIKLAMPEKPEEPEIDWRQQSRRLGEPIRVVSQQSSEYSPQIQVAEGPNSAAMAIGEHTAVVVDRPGSSGNSPQAARRPQTATVVFGQTNAKEEQASAHSYAPQIKEAHGPQSAIAYSSAHLAAAVNVEESTNQALQATDSGNIENSFPATDTDLLVDGDKGEGQNIEESPEETQAGMQRDPDVLDPISQGNGVDGTVEQEGRVHERGLNVLRWYTNVVKSLADYNASILGLLQSIIMGECDECGDIA